MGDDAEMNVTCHNLQAVQVVLNCQLILYIIISLK